MHMYDPQGFQKRLYLPWREVVQTASEPKKVGRKIVVQSVVRGPFFTATVLALCTILIRLPNFGDPTYHIDEAFYLFVGEQMGNGLLLYAEVWDRKPAGLFVLYAVIAQLGSVLAYQALAALFAWGTALTLALIASHFVGRTAACAVGVVYLALIGTLAGGGGQSPVFYNLFVAVAGLLVLRRALAPGRPMQTLAGEGAMLLCGLALTVKPTALAEGVVFGLTLLYLQWRRTRGDALQLALYSVRLAAPALAPTLLIWGYFHASGELGAYWFATMESIFLTQSASAEASAVRLAWLVRILWLPVLAAAGGLLVLVRAASGRPGRERRIAAFVSGWFGAATIGFLLVPNFYDHYALPLASVLALSAAPLFDRRGIGLVLAIVLSAHLLLLSGFPGGQLNRKAEAQAGFAAATHLIERYERGGCIFVYDVTPALYRSFTPCPANRYAFPEHLSNEREAGAIGTNPLLALHRVLAHKPSVIIRSAAPSLSTPNLTTRRVLQQELGESYTLVGEATLVDVVGRQRIEILARRRVLGRQLATGLTALELPADQDPADLALSQK